MSKDYKKLYEEALERAKIFKSPFCQHAAEVIFPELRESEDEKIRKELINFFSKGAEYDSSTNGIKDRNIIAWLEKQGEQTLTWSEEDEKMFNKIIDELTPYGECPDYPSQEEQEYYYIRPKMIDWLKSIKPSHWKPSREQMKALDKAKNSSANYYNIKLGLQSLYNDLLKL